MAAEPTAGRPEPAARPGNGEEEGERRRRRRGRRGGRRRRRGGEEGRFGEPAQPAHRESARPPEAEPRPPRMETPADWTPYPPMVDEEPTLPEPSPPSPREEPAHAGNGGRAEGGEPAGTDLSSDIGAPAGGAPLQPAAEEPPVATSEMATPGAKRRGGWQRIVE
jgi:ribonuclease E